MAEKQLLASVHGIKKIYFAIMDPATGKVITGANGVSDTGFTYVDGDGQGATSADISALEEKGVKKYANNQVKRIAHGIPAPEVAVVMLDMPRDLMYKLLGYVKSGSGYVPNTGIKPHVAMIIESDTYDGNKAYEAFANGEVIMPAVKHGTDTNNQTESDPTLTYDALAPIDDETFIDANGNQSIIGFYNSGDTDFTEEKMFSEVFKGYTTGVTTPGTTGVTTPSAPNN